MARPNKPWFRASKGTWYARINGKMTSLGVRGKENRKAAYEAWHLKMVGAKQPSPAVPPESKEVLVSASATIQTIADRFLADARSRLKPNTLIWYDRTMNVLAETFGPRPANGVLPDELEGWLRGTGWGDTTRNHAITILRIAFRWAERRRLITEDPTRYLTKPPNKSRGVEAVLATEDHAKLIAAAHPAFKDVLAVLYATGARPSEVAAITADNFDPASGVAILEDHKTARHGKRRVIYLTPAVVDLLANLKKRRLTGPLLRNAKGRPWTKDAIVLAMKRLRDRTGVRATAYFYRHSYATDLLAGGVPDAQVAELLGHSGTAMLARHYSHLGSRSQILRAALNNARC